MQKSIFKNSESDCWYNRNKKAISEKRPSDDLILREVIDIGEKLNSKKQLTVLEVGCSNGWRLIELKKKGYSVMGFDPSVAAVEDSHRKNLLDPGELKVADAHEFFRTNKLIFDIIIFGHCLYLIDPDNIPDVVAGSYNSLNLGGFIVIFDFDSSNSRNKYIHKDGVFSYKSHYDKFWTWMPTMRLVKKIVTNHDGSLSEGNQQESCALSVVRKISQENGYPMFQGDIKIGMKA